MQVDNLNSVLFAGQKKAILALEDGTIFHGISIGYQDIDTSFSVGEVVFNTAMTGYQEILSDPSYCEQIVTLTYPHIGNTGCNSADNESDKTYVKGLIIKDLPKLASSWRMQESLEEYLQKNKIMAIANLDTRELTKILRTKGALNGCIMNQNIDEKLALQKAKEFEGLNNLDLAIKVTCDKPYQWQQGEFDLTSNQFAESNTRKFKVVCYDYGVKHNILRILSSLNCELHVVSADTDVQTVLDMKPDGVFLSNGPGDPAACDYAIENVNALLNTKIPVFGICLGHQILALASGAKTEKMKFGHHGANHPVQDLQTKEVMITSQNHGFAVSEDDIPDTLQITHKSLFDGSVQAIRRTDCFAYSFQGHPEASPGPHDAKKIFMPFIEKMQENANA